MAFFPNVDAIQEFKIESNSPPAEFGRFNGGVVNLTTKSGGNTFHGDGVRVLPARVAERAQLLRVDHPGKPEFRRNQFGGVARRSDPARSHVLLRRLPGPAADDRPDRDLDGADAAAAAGHLHRSRSAAACRPSTIRPPPRRGTGGATRTPFAGQHDSGRTASIPSPGRCSSAIRCRPAPAPRTTIGASTNETVDQDQFSVRLDHRFAPDRDHVFGRLTRFQRGIHPGDPAAGRERRHVRNAGPAGHARRGRSRRSYQRIVLEPTWSTSFGSATRGARCDRRPPSSTARRRALWVFRGFLRTRSFPNTLPTFLIGGYQQLGSPAEHGDATSARA